MAVQRSGRWGWPKKMPIGVPGALVFPQEVGGYKELVVVEMGCRQSNRAPSW